MLMCPPSDEGDKDGVKVVGDQAMEAEEEVMEDITVEVVDLEEVVDVMAVVVEDGEVVGRTEAVADMGDVADTTDAKVCSK